MKYRSTRGICGFSFEDAVMMGLADDGGLLLPEFIPQVQDRFSDWTELSYPDLALEIVSLFCDDIPREDLRSLVNQAYDPQRYCGSVAPLEKLGPTYLLELIHGPTLAFKDVALQLLGQVFRYILEKRGSRLNILAATSGDTGSAAIYGVRGQERVNIFVMHPQGRVSPLQERQMTCVLDPNVHNLAVEGTFDDCQALLKQVFSDLPFKARYSLGAVNSVNWCRVLAQIVYYFSAGLRVLKETGADQLNFAIPTGNFGNFLAAWYASRMGLPIANLLLATNQNDILARFFTTLTYQKGQVHHTLAPAMDIQVASNFERYLYYAVDCDPLQLQRLLSNFQQEGHIHLAQLAPGPAVVAGSVDDDAILATLAQVYRDFGKIVDPHTATAIHLSRQSSRVPLVVVSTAHPAKFPEAILAATGTTVTHPRLEPLKLLPRRTRTVANSAEAIKDLIAGAAP